MCDVVVFTYLQGKVVFHDPKDIVVDGHVTKQITLTATGEVCVYVHALSL